MTNYQITPASQQDAAALSLLVNSAYRGESSRQGWTTEADLLDGTRTDADVLKGIMARPGTVILKYIENGQLLACVELQQTGAAMYLGMLTVQPGLQGRGIGKRLLFAAEDVARQQQCSKMYMTVISVRAELIAWYVRHGYTDTGERKPFHFDDPRFGQPKRELEFMVLEKQL